MVDHIPEPALTDKAPALVPMGYFAPSPCFSADIWS